MSANTWLNTWIRVVAFPGDGAFLIEIENERAGLATATVWMVVAAVLAAVVNGLEFLFNSYIFDANGFLEQLFYRAGVPSDVMAKVAGPNVWAIFLGVLVSTALVIFVGFMVGTTFYWGGARLLGGEGTFAVQTYLLASFSAPLVVIASLLAVVPFLGSCLVALVVLYGLALTFFALNVAHDLDPGRTLMALFVPVLVGALVFLCSLGFYGPSIADALSGGA